VVEAKVGVGVKVEVQDRFEQNDPNHSRPRRRCKDRSSCIPLMEAPRR
jgi:hypothetical protein